MNEPLNVVPMCSVDRDVNLVLLKASGSADFRAVEARQLTKWL